MSNHKYDLAVFIGRFQPVHNGHVEVLRQASLLADKVLVIIGSSFRPLTYKNPFSANLRTKMISQAFYRYASNMSTLSIECNSDTIYNDNAWVLRVQEFVSKHVSNIENPKIAIIGHEKDSSSEYLNWFPTWSIEKVPLVEPLDATQVRSLYFVENPNLGFIKSVVPSTTYSVLEEFSKTDDFKTIVNERKFLDKHSETYRNLPYPPTFQTADAVVTQSGHLLVVKRRAEPGKGLLALPGGYLNAKTDKSILNCAVRELIEETKIKVPEKVLYGSIVNSQVFDAIGRSERGRIITQAFHFELSNKEPLPKVKGSDDAEKAFWLPFSDISSELFFEDHYDIIQYFLGVLTTDVNF